MQPGQGTKQVQQAPRMEMRQNARNFTLTPKFGTRKINLRAADKRELDNIISELRGAQDLNRKIAVWNYKLQVNSQPRYKSLLR